MKLSEYTKQQGISYRTAFRWWQAGTIKGYQAPSGTIIVTESERPSSIPEKVAIYARVSSQEHQENLERQAERLKDYCAAKGYQVSSVVKEIASGANDSRPKFLALLRDTSITHIVVEHKDRMTRFGANYILTLLETQGRHVEMVNLADDDKEDLIQDLSSIFYSFCARMYGQRRAKRKTEVIVKELQTNGEEQQMQLVEQHCINKNDVRYAVIDVAAFASKNLYNAANYLVRQSFLHDRIYKGYATVYHEVKSHESYQALPAKVANDVLRLLEKNWKSFFKAMQAYKQDPSQFVGPPALPKYKDKQVGRNILIYDIQALSKTALRNGVIVPSKLSIEIPTKQTTVQQVRIIPRCGFYMVEVVYNRKETLADVDPSLMAAVDIGVNNLVALTSNKRGFTPQLVNGRPIKSVNQFYNKRKAALQHKLGDTRFTPRMERITIKRTRRIDHYLHTASKRIVDLLVSERIGTLIIGKNPLWKQDLTMRKKDTQHFIQIPHARFITMLTYKAQLVGIQVIIQEESYTSKASFLDNDPIPTYGHGEENPMFLRHQDARSTS